MDRVYFIVLVFAFAFYGCMIENGAEELNKFVIPKVINSRLVDSISTELFESNYIEGVFPKVVGKYKFNNFIDINFENRDTSFRKDWFDETQLRRIRDSLDVNGFELFVDYNQTIKYNPYINFGQLANGYYPVFFVNSTKSDKIFLGKDSYIMGIQEAIREEKWKRWRPIEARGFDFCGNGSWGMIVHPNEFVVVLMNKYKGGFPTQLRVRYVMGNNIFVSKPFFGSIDSSQFHIKDSSYVKRQLQRTKGRAAQSLFYGAEPREEDWR